MWLFCFEDVQTTPNTMYKKIMACRWPAPGHYLNQRWYILPIGPLQTNFSENLIEIHIFAFKKMHFKMSAKMAFILSGPQWVDMNQVFMLVYSTGRSVTMPELDQNWSLLPALGRFRRHVVLANYGVKKKLQGNMCWADLGSISAQRRFDVGLMSPADVGPTSVRRQSQYLIIIIKTNRNVPQWNATIHFCP